MNPDAPKTPREEIEMRLTALLMGELPPDEAAALQKQIDGDPTLADLHRRLKNAMELLREATAIPEPTANPVPVQLSSERREKLLAHFKTPAKPAPSVIVRPRRDWRPYVPLGLAAALVAFLGLSLTIPQFAVREPAELADPAPASPEPTPSKYWFSFGSLTADEPPPGRDRLDLVTQSEGTLATDRPTDLGTDRAGREVAISYRFRSQLQSTGVGAESKPTQLALPFVETAPAGPAEVAASGAVATWDVDSVGTKGSVTKSDKFFALNPAPPMNPVPANAESATGPTEATVNRSLGTQELFAQAAQDPVRRSGGRGGFAGGSVTPMQPAEPTAGSKVVRGEPPLLDWDRGTSAHRESGLQRETAVAAPTAEGVTEQLAKSDAPSTPAPARPSPIAAGGIDRAAAPTLPAPSGEIIDGFAVPTLPAPSGAFWAENGDTVRQQLRDSAATIDDTPPGRRGYFASTAKNDRPSAGDRVTTFYDADGAKLGDTDGDTNGRVSEGRAAQLRFGNGLVADPEGKPTIQDTATMWSFAGAANDRGRRLNEADKFIDAVETAEPAIEEKLAKQLAPTAPSSATASDKSKKPNSGGETAAGFESLTETLGRGVKTKRGSASENELQLMQEAEASGSAAKSASIRDEQRLAKGKDRRKEVTELSKLEAAQSQMNREAFIEPAAKPITAARGKRPAVIAGKRLEVEAKNQPIPEDIVESVVSAEADASKTVAESELPAVKLQEEARDKQVPELAKLESRPRLELKKDSGDQPVAPKPAAPAPVPQPEIATSANAFSTFSLNVTDVSFKLAAASLEQGKMPEHASIRTEEFINAFDYHDPQPAAGAPLAFSSERARYPFAQNRDLLRLSVKTAAAGRQPGRALNLVLLLDNSGSMERADRVRILNESLRVLSTQLQPQDKLSVVTFSRSPRLWADGVAGDKAREVTARVGEITPQGGTNLSAALDLGYATALKHFQPGSINRVVLITDGAANLGDVNPDALKEKVEAHRKRGVALDCFGIGWEGLDDTLLEALSRNGDGRYGFINTPEQAATEFAGQLAGALRVAASDVKVQVEFNPRRVTSYRQIGYAKHQLKKEQFRDNTVDAAEIGAAESGNALYAIEVNPRGQGEIATVRVRFKVPGTTDYREHEWTVPFEREAAPLEQANPTLRLAATASAFSEMLAESPFAAEVTSDRLLALLNGVSATFGADPRPAKLEWMIRTAKSISGK